VILYEYPFNERIRTLLRLEHLFDRLAQLVERIDPIDHHFALTSLFEVLDVAARADLKTEVLKDLERQKAVFNGFRGNPAIAEATLDSVVSQMEGAFRDLHELPGKVGQSLSDDEWLMSIRSRANIPGGTCEFDLPAYFAWQHEDPAERQAYLRRRVLSLAPLSRAVSLLLGVLRDSGHPQMVAAAAGQFQQTLPQTRTYQLLRLRIDESLRLIPEITGHRLLVTVRLLRREADGKVKPTNDDAAFELALCA
jgi:cell division protein ZapD